MAIPSTAIYSGTCGTCNWYVTRDRELIIEPQSGSSGYIGSFVSYPWAGSFGSDEVTNSFVSATIVTGVTFSEGTGYIKNTSDHMFAWCENLETITGTQSFWNSFTDAGSIFAFCKNLKSVNFNGASFVNAKRMSNMFYNCQSLTSIDISSFNTSNVEDVSDMFDGCTALSEITIGNYFYVPLGNEIGIAPCVNEDSGIRCENDLSFSALETSERAGTWLRTVESSFSVTAVRTTDGEADEDGADATITVSWATEASTTDRTISIYKKLSSDPSYPQQPDVEDEQSGNSGEFIYTFSDIGDYAYDFRVEFYDGTNTFVAFPSVATNIHLVDIKENGDVKVYGDLSCANIKCGQVNGVSVSANSTHDYTVTFTEAFTEAPIVVIGIRSDLSYANIGNVSVGAANVTTSGFTARVFNGSSTARNVYMHWIATTVGKQ